MMMILQQKIKYAVSVAFAFIIVMACKHSRSHKEIIDWKKYKSITEAYLRDSAYEKIFPLDSLIYNVTKYELTDINGFAGFSLNCVTADYETRHVDIYPLLRIIQNQLMNQADSVQEQFLIQLSGFYGKLGLYRRAFETLNLKPLPSDTLFRKKKELATFLKKSESYANIKIRNKKEEYVNENGAIIGRLCDLLTAQPENGWYEEFNVDEAGHDSSNNIVSDSLVERSSVKETAGDLFSFLTRGGRVNQVPPGPEIRSQVDSFSELPVARQYREQLIRLVQDVKDNENSSEWMHSPAIDVLLDASNAVAKEPLIAGNVAVFNRLSFENNLILSLYDESAFIIYIIKIAPDKNVQVYAMQVYDIETMRLVSATGTAQKQLLITTRSGSGGYLDIILVDIDQVNTIFQESELYHGGLALVDLDNDSALEIIATQATGERIVECNQCPSPYYTELFDFDARIGRFSLIALDSSGSELLTNTNDNLMGFGPLMIRTGGKSFSGPNIYILTEKFKQKGKNNSTANDIKSIQRAYRSEYNILESTNDFEHAATLGKSMLDLFKLQYISPDKYPEFYLEVFEDLLRSLTSTGDYLEFHKIENDKFYHTIIDTSKDGKSYNLNLKGIVYLYQGQYGNAYDCLLNNYKQENDSGPVSAGNLALYYSLVNDTASYYKYSLEAVDKAIKSDVNIAVNFLHVAKSGVGKLSETEQLDYLIRAIKVARGSTDGEQILMILQAAAQIAVNNDLPELGLKLLDQAILFTTNTDWEQEGAYIMFLYSKCLKKMNMLKEACNTLKTSAKLSSGISREAYITSCYELSKIYYSVNKPDDAFYYSQLAFDSVKTFRKTITELDHKFSFLVNKKEIVGWYFKLLLQKQQPPVNIFNALESWKMRSFVDAYDEKGIYKDLGSDGQTHTIAQRLQRLLQPTDLLIDFSINKEVSFAVTMTSSAQQLQSLNYTSDEIKRLVSDVRQYMDVRNPESIDLIRRDKVSSSMKASLSSLGAALLGTVKIPAEVKRIIILPDEALYGIPWSALVMKGDDSYFIEKYDYSIFPSAAIAYSILTHLPTIPVPKLAVVLASLGEVSNLDVRQAAPVLTNSFPDISFAKLSSGGNEARLIGGTLKKQGFRVNYLLDRNTIQTFNITDPVNVATRSNLVNEMKNANILHCITHGIFNAKDPMQSCIFVENDNGNRTVKPIDLIDSNLSNLYMISLNACQTGINNLMPGSEPIGFLRSFLAAGTSHILLTEWEVDDKTTSNLFENFYSILSKKDASTALNEAKLAIKEKYNHPYYWSGVTLYGSPH